VARPARLVAHPLVATRRAAPGLVVEVVDVAVVPLARGLPARALVLGLALVAPLWMVLVVVALR